MCNNHNINPDDPFADIDESEFEAELAKPDAPVRSLNPHVESIGNVEVPGFEENCPKCRGTGSYGRVTRLGHSQCTKCKGKGKLTFKTSPEARAKARASAKASKQRKAERDRETFLESLDGDVREWLVANEGTNGFAADLLRKGPKWGLTEGQVNGVRKAIARDADAKAGAQEWIDNHEAEYQWLVRESEAGNEFAESLLNGQYGLIRRGVLSENQLNAVRRNLAKDGGGSASELDISGLKGYYAVPDGDTRLKLCVRKPGKNSRYHGWTFVDDGAAYGSRRTYGKQRPDGLYQGDVQEALATILKDPLAAQVAYGKLTGTCGYCGRLLEDEESVARGIGPICAAKYS